MSIEAEMRAFPEERARLEKTFAQQHSSASRDWAAKEWNALLPAYGEIHREVRAALMAKSRAINLADLGGEILLCLIDEATHRGLEARMPHTVRNALHQLQRHAPDLAGPEVEPHTFDFRMKRLLNCYRVMLGAVPEPIPERARPSARSDADAARNPE